MVTAKPRHCAAGLLEAGLIVIKSGIVSRIFSPLDRVHRAAHMLVQPVTARFLPPGRALDFEMLERSDRFDRQTTDHTIRIESATIDPLILDTATRRDQLRSIPCLHGQIKSLADRYRIDRKV